MDSTAYENLINEALRFVSFRPRSAAEIRSYLEKRVKLKKITENEVIQTVFGRLVELDYANDEKFTQWWITSRRSTKPKGNLAIKQELLQKGVDRETIAKYLNSVPENSFELGVTQYDLAQKSISSKLRVWKNLPPIEFKKRVISFLLRRGFTADVAYRVIDAAGGKDYNTTVDT